MLKIFGFILILCVATTLTYPAVLTKPNEDVMLVRLNRAADAHTYDHGHHHDSRPHGGYHHGHYHDHYHGHHGHESGHHGGHHGGYGK